MNLFTPTWFMEGLWHPPQTPSQLLVLLALAVFAGQQGRLFPGSLLLFFIASLIGGFVLNHFYTPNWNVELFLLVIALITSLLVVLRLELSPGLSKWVLLPFALISGVMLGLDSTPIMIPGLGNEITYNWLAGALTSMLLLFSVLNALSYVSRNLVNGVVLRVAGSWIATSALFVLTLLFVKQ